MNALDSARGVANVDLLERVLGLVAFEAADHGVGIETHLDPELSSIPSDEGQLSQVLLNVILNAFQAMPDGARSW